MKNVNVFLIGGLGNNLFQISLGDYLKQTGHRVTYNSYFLKKNFITKFMGWTIHSSEVTNEILKAEEVRSGLNFVDIFYLLVFFSLSKLKLLDISSPNKNKIFFRRCLGYWQENNVINKNFVDRVKSYFYKGVTSEAYNVIHVRRGDFSECSQLTWSYYLDAIKVMKENKYMIIANQDDVFYEFQERLKNEKLKCKVEFIKSTGKNFKEDFSLMIGANKVIMSNSTFCYWAVQLGNSVMSIYPNKISPNRYWKYCMNNMKSMQINAKFRRKEGA
jgi:hypothetical protein